MAQSVLVLITKAPYGYEEGFAGARLALSQLAGGLITKCNVLLVGDGTLNAVSGQKPEALKMPSNADSLGDLLDFEAKVYCVKEDLKERVGDVPILESVTAIDWQEARKIIADHDMVTTF
ncbi:MAG TPA: DsrE family protein [Methanomassiliicoccales archaeon]|jgi:tRNA 2-thiouridine synthesizing protein C